MVVLVFILSSLSDLDTFSSLSFLTLQMQCTANACAVKSILSITIVFPKSHINSEPSLFAAVNTEYLGVAFFWLYISYFLESAHNNSTIFTNISQKIRKIFRILLYSYQICRLPFCFLVLFQCPYTKQTLFKRQWYKVDGEGSYTKIWRNEEIPKY